MIARAATALLIAMTGLPALAQSVAAVAEAVDPTEIRALYDALELPGIVDVMSREGAQYGEALAETMFGGMAIPASWSEAVADIYDPAIIEERALASLEADLVGEDVGAMIAFFEAEPGRTIAGLELSAREAMLDDDVEEAAKEMAAVAMAEEDPRLDLVRRYAEANDLIETNVVGALNTNVAYFMGLMDGGALGQDMTETDVLADVRSQESQIRADTTEWVYSFLLMAYQPASDEDIEALIAFSATEPGQALNRAVFRAFDGTFEDISHALGVVSARYMTTEEL